MRTLVALVLACVLAGVIWWFVGGGGGGAPRPNAPSAMAPAHPSARAAATAAGSPTAGNEHAGALPRVAAGTAPPAAGGTIACRVRVVRAPDGEPVADASLCWLPRDFDFDVLPADEQALWSSDREAIAMRHGRHTTTDAEGRAVVPAGREGGVEVWARAGEAFAEQRVAPDPFEVDHEITITLRTDRGLVVRVLDARGNRAPDVPVVLLRGGESLRLGTSDTHGEIHIAHTQERFAAAKPQHAAAELRARLFGGEGPPTAIDLAALPDEPVVVRAPPFGSFELVLLGPDGQPWPLPSGVHDGTVAIERADQPAGTARLAPQTVPFDPDGHAVLSPVACGARFRVTVHIAVPIQRLVEGPTANGERVRVELGCRRRTRCWWDASSTATVHCMAASSCCNAAVRCTSG